MTDKIKNFLSKKFGDEKLYHPNQILLFDIGLLDSDYYRFHSEKRNEAEYHLDNLKLHTVHIDPNGNTNEDNLRFASEMDLDNYINNLAKCIFYEGTDQYYEYRDLLDEYLYSDIEYIDEVDEY